MNNFIPVEAYVNGKMKIWHIDVSGLGINELIILKKELEGNKTDSINYLNAIIHQTIGYNNDDLKMSRRELKKENRTYRNQKALVRRNKRKRR